MKKLRSNLFKLVIAITFLVILLVVIALNQPKDTPSSGSKMDSELYSPFIVFAPGFAAFFELGY